MEVILGRLNHARMARLSVLATLDGLLAALSLVIAFLLRMNGQAPAQMSEGLLLSLPVFAVVTPLIFYAIGAYNRVWRYASVTDLTFMLRAITAAICVSVAVLLMVGQLDWMPASVPLIQWFVMIVLVGGARLARRLHRERVGKRVTAVARPDDRARRPSRRALLVGPADRVEIVLRFLESNHYSGYDAVGVLDDCDGHLRLNLRGVPMLGTTDALEDVVKRLEADGRRPECLIIAESKDNCRGPRFVRLVTRAEALDLSVARLPDPTEPARTSLGELDLRFIDMAELLGRPQAVLDTSVVARHIAGKSVMVTGAGGTIGRELARQIAALSPGKLILLDNGEFNLYSVDQDIQESCSNVPRVAVLCSVRRREALMRVFATHRPDFVFHAAALKHVPMVEKNPPEGVHTNVIGTRNVADACRRYKVRAMVQVSTDKAVNPVGMMGATKRLGELYCQAMDLEGRNMPDAPRFLIVRFGNVLGSSGSLIPLFQRQLSQRGPLTVTHPEIERFFMTVHEAVQLVLQSMACALDRETRRGRIFVLDMGKPIKIVEVAHRMIRLAGLEPGVDVKIDFVGLRPGEKLYEELFDDAERRQLSPVPGIFEAEPVPVPLRALADGFDRLHMACIRDDAAAVREQVSALLALSRKWADQPEEAMPAMPALDRARSTEIAAE